MHPFGWTVSGRGGSYPQTAPAPCPHPSDSPHQLLPWASSLAVCHLCPAQTQAVVLTLWVISPAGASLIRVDTPGVATGRPAALNSHPGEPAMWLEEAELTWIFIIQLHIMGEIDLLWASHCIKAIMQMPPPLTFSF